MKSNEAMAPRILAGDVVRAAIQARTVEDAVAVQRMIETLVGAHYERSVGDKVKNDGLLAGGSASYDHKLIENVTNMQDALLERAAVEKFGAIEKVPYRTPREARDELFRGTDYKNIANGVAVDFYESDRPTSASKRITVVFRDHGCGMTPAGVPATIFALGGSHKDSIPWQQGAFGLGGAVSFRNARKIVLVTRRAPKMLGVGEKDQITVAVAEWISTEKGKSLTYLVTNPWNNPGDQAEPFAVPATAAPDFEPGTHLAFISYGVEGYHRARAGDEKSFPTVLDTRLFDPITPVRWRDHIHEKADTRYLRGLERRLLDAGVRSGEEEVPFNVSGKTYRLPVRFWLFSKPGEPGSRKNFVAHDHALLLTSNGQVHKHYTPQQFRYLTELNKLHDRILIVVQTGELPIQVRSDIFTADRSDAVRTEHWIRLEQTVMGFLDEWPELRDINNELIREAIKGGDERPTIRIAEQIRRALKVRGFSLSALGASGGGSFGSPRQRHPKPPPKLLVDPTMLEGPATAIAVAGTTKFITYVLNAVDEFVPRRGQLEIVTTHPEITSKDCTVGTLRRGRVRVSIAVPSGATLGTFEVKVSIRNWIKAAGGFGANLNWVTKLDVVEKRREPPPKGAGDKKGKGGPSEGGMVAVIWKSGSEVSSWEKMTVGEIQNTPADALAQEHSDYRELAALGGTLIPTILLNTEYPPLKDYISARAQELTGDGEQGVKDRFAVGTGVGLLLLDKSRNERMAAGERVSDELLADAQEAVARGVLSMMPMYDKLAREAFGEDSS
jgi:hypothetical protein